MSDEPEIYPMPMHARLVVSDLDEASTWYEDVLGFRRVFALSGTVHLRYAKYADVLLVSGRPEARPGESDDDAVDSLTGSDVPRGVGVSLSFTVADETVDDIADRVAAAETAVVEGPVDRPWNTREVVVRDPEGYELVFTEPIDAERSFDEVASSWE